MPAAKAAATKVVAAVKVANAAAKAASKPKAPAPSTTGRPTGLQKVVNVSPILEKFLGVSEINRQDTMKKVWDYIKDRGLQNPENKREVICDEQLKKIFGKDRVIFHEVPVLLKSHFLKTEP